MNPNLSPNPDRPRMILRFRAGQEQNETWKRTLPELLKYRAACDEVWFSTGIGYPPMETHRKNSEIIAAHARELRALGIRAGLQIQATLGHGDALCATTDCSGKTWSGYTALDGTQCRFCSCPRQTDFQNYFREIANLYAQWHPASVWFDDDLRISNHAPVMEHGGCCCDHCLALFSEEEGHRFSRSELADALRHDPELRTRRIRFGIRGLAELATVIVEVFHRISPETRIGLQHNSDPERNDLFDALAGVTKTRVGSRPGGGAYTDYNPFCIVQKAFQAADMKAAQRGYDTLDQVCAEIESWPRVYTCKTSRGLRLESMISLAAGMDSLSYFIMDQSFETPEWYGSELLAPLAQEAPAYKNFILKNQGTFPGGAGCSFQYPMPGLEAVGIPCAAASPFACCQMITADRAENLSDEALTALLRGDIMLEGKAVAELQKRGFASSLCGLRAFPCDNLAEFWTDDPVNCDLSVPMRRPSPDSFRFEFPENSAARILGVYRTPGGTPGGTASVLFTRADGTRIAAIGCAFRTDCVSTSQVNFFRRVADWTAHGLLPVLPDSPVRCLLIPRIEPDGTLRSVTVANTTIAPHKPFTLRLRKYPVKSETAMLIVPGNAPVAVAVHRRDGEAFVEIPELAAWDVCTLQAD